MSKKIKVESFNALLLRRVVFIITCLCQIVKFTPELAPTNVTKKWLLEPFMVPEMGLEPIWISPFDFKSNAYTNSAIRARFYYITFLMDWLGSLRSVIE